MDHPRFNEGAITTAFIAEEYPEGFQGVTLPDEELASKLVNRDGTKVYLGVRPENLGLKGYTNIEERDNAIQAVVEVVEPLGAETHVIASIGGDQTIVARVDSHAQVEPGQQITFLAKQEALHAFDMESESNLRFA